MFYFKEKSNIKYINSSILENDFLVHAFSTRIGENKTDFTLGTSGIKELKPQVEKNRTMICSALALDYEKIINPEQKHTDNIKIVSNINENVSNTDGLITAEPEIVLMLLFADCVPVILFSPEKRVLGVIHAGWKGSAKKITQKAISIFEKDFSVKPEEINAAIGPAIGQCCYPVSSDTAIELHKSINKNHAKIFTENNKTDKINVDLKKLNAQQLKEIGVINIDASDLCTSCKYDTFFSYRAENGLTGRHAAIASIKKEVF